MKVDELFFSIDKQLETLKAKKRITQIEDAASIRNGIQLVSEKRQKELVKTYDDFKGHVIKFVPASGAASRMFKHIYSLSDPNNVMVSMFLDRITEFPFYDVLKEECLRKHTVTPLELIAEDRLDSLSALIMGEEGLNYAKLPKGLIPFYLTDKAYNPFQIHLIESKYYSTRNGSSSIHFTVPPAHINDIKDLLETFIGTEKNVSYNLEYSIQLPETNTVALNSSSEIVRTSSGDELLRPGGHGALIYNLNQIDADLIFIKNIDNVVREENMESQALWKKTLAGLLLETQNKIFEFQRHYDNSKNLSSAKEYLENMFGYDTVNTDNLQDLLYRPIRVCGMVVNQGQPGGGPFYVRNTETGKALQIVESAELDSELPRHAESLEKASHFNPVDIVCSIKNHKGEKYNLLDFVDNEACFTSCKDFEGQEIKILELPGLWNGAMAKWNTLFVEVPAHTFNPVKTVNDLLKESYLG